MPRTLPEADVAAINQVFTDALLALEENDVDTWLSYWTEDAMQMLPGLPLYQGHAQLREVRPRIGGKKYVLSDIRAEGLEDLAVVTTAITFPDAGPGGESVEGKQMFKLRKEGDGKWRIAAAIVNFNAPASL